MLNREIEIHDSELASLAVSPGQVVLDFSAVYIHQSEGRPGIDPGTGWTQHVIVRVRGNIDSGSLGQLPCKLSSGTLTLQGRQLENTLPIPSEFGGEVELYLDSECGESIRIRGNRITIESIGEPTYIEQFPGTSST